MIGCTDILPAWWHDPHDASARPRNLSGGWRWLISGVAVESLIGGYLPNLLELADIEWMIASRDIILFTDAMGQDPLMVDGMLGGRRPWDPRSSQ